MMSEFKHRLDAFMPFQDWRPARKSPPPSARGSEMTDAIARMNAARRFPDHTCPASRHAAMIAEDLVKGRAPQDLAHAGESIAVVVEALWKARRYAEAKKGKTS